MTDSPSGPAAAGNFAKWPSRGEGTPRQAQPRPVQSGPGIPRRGTGFTVASSLNRSGTTQLLANGGIDWIKQNCLTLDGGGIRGYWSLLVIQKLMHNISVEEENQDKAEQDRREEKRKSRETRHPPQAHSHSEHFHNSFQPLRWPEHVSQKGRTKTTESWGKNEKGEKVLVPSSGQRFLPCHYFDYICGSSTGALIAIMLSRFRMTVEDCMDEYKNLAGQIFGNPSKLVVFNVPLISNRTKYNTENVQAVFEDLTRRRAGKDKDPPHELTTERFVSQTCVLTMAGDVPRTGQDNLGASRVDYPFALTSYNSRQNESSLQNVDRTWTITEISRAATAVPLYFKELQIDIRNGSKRILTDAGLGQLNNPTKYIVDQLQQRHRNKNRTNDLDIVVSVGTARKTETRTGRPWSRIREIIDQGANPDVVHREVEAKSKEEGFTYFRFNDPGSLGIELDEWKPRKDKGNLKSGEYTIREITSAFEHWYAKKKNFAPFIACARVLVSRRRQRAMNEDLWDRFANASSYRCNHPNCSDQRFELKDTFIAHWKDCHLQDEVESDLEAICRQHREEWEYQEKPPS